MIGLLPLTWLGWLALSGGAMRGLAVVENPPMVAASDLEKSNAAPKEEDWVVGLLVGRQAVAYPYEQLFLHPLVVQPLKDSVLVVMWSADANRASCYIAEGARGGDFRLISMPANTLLVRNTRTGEFISSVTGKTLSGETPRGFVRSVKAVKTRWGQWRSAHPDTLVSALPVTDDQGNKVGAPTGPILPRQDMPSSAAKANTAEANVGGFDVSASQLDVVLVESERGGERGGEPGLGGGGVALLPSDVSDVPLNLTVVNRCGEVTQGDKEVKMGYVVVRHWMTGAVLAFERKESEEARQRFARPPSAGAWGERPAGLLPLDAPVLIDVNTGITYAASGKALSPADPATPALVPVPIDEGLPWDVLHHHMPDLLLVLPTIADIEPLPQSLRPVPVRAAQPARTRPPTSNNRRTTSGR